LDAEWNLEDKYNVGGGLFRGWYEMNYNGHKIEYSPLCEKVTRGKITVAVQIYRITNSAEGWSQEVTDEEGASTVWNDLFTTDRDAYAAFLRTIDATGIATFLSDHRR
jgi:hypothetical protein